MNRIFSFPFAILFATFLFISGCSTDDEVVPEDNTPIENPDPDPDPTPNPDPEPGQDPLSIQLESQLDGNVMGYSFAVLRNGEIVEERSGGFALNSADGNVEMSTTFPMHVASVSKFITTVATLHTLEQNGLGTDETITGFLPNDWSQGPGIETLTFMDLMAQRAGLNDYGTQLFNANRFDSLELIVAAGAEQLRQRFYNNNHHSLFRIILPVVNDVMTGVSAIDYTATSTSTGYESIVQGMLEPLSITASLDARTLPTVGNYSTVLDTESGSGRFIDFTPVAGAYGWHISTSDLAKFWQKVWYTEEIISNESRVQMTENAAGLFETREGDFGTYYMKDGFWAYSGNPPSQLQTIVAHFPDDTDLILFINSSLNNGAWLGSVAISAYEDSRQPG